MASYSTTTSNDFEAPLLINREDDDHEILKPQDTSTGVHSYTSSGIWCKITFQWLNPVFRRGRQIRKLELSHIPPLPPSQTAQSASAWLQESLVQHSSLRKAIWRTMWMPLLINAVFAGISAIASFTGPFLLTYLVNYMLSKHDGSTNMHYGVMLALIFFSSKTLESFTERQLKFGGRKIGLQVRAALTALLYKKSISMKYYSGPSSGEISTLMVDVETIGELFSDIQDVWLTPLKVLLALIILYINLGVAPCVTAFVTTVLVLVCSTPVTKLQKTLHSKISEARDSRMKKTTETLNSIRVVKFNSWESRFSDKLLQLREIEKSWIKRFLNMKSLGVLLFWTSPTIVSVTTFGVCIMVKTPLEPSTVLSALTTIAILGDPMFTLSDLISYIAKAGVAIDRIQALMKRSEDHQIEVIPTRHTTSKVPEDTMIEIETGEFAWNTINDDDNQNLQSRPRPAIKITEKINIMKGKKVAVCGSVGSGKSSLLCSMLGEIPQISGVAGGAKVHGTKAYVPQSPWIQTGTMRENVLFGKDLDWARYEDVLEACALDQDIKLLANGDMTSVGERGMNLSGGQKQRVQLARAVYSDSEVYILDDPFSAVDAHTGSHLFQNCLLHLLSTKTVIYATHQLEFLEAADLVLVVKDGLIAQCGTYEELTDDPNGELVRLMTAHCKSLHQVQTCPQEDSISSIPSTSTTTSSSSSSSSSSNDSEEEKRVDVELETNKEAFSNAKVANKESQEKEEEEAGTGGVKWSVYSTFVTYAYSGLLVPIILLCHVLFQGLQMASNYWIAYATGKQNRVTRGKLMWVFSLLSGGSSLFLLGRAVLMSVVTVETSQRLFLRMTTSIFQAPMAFFDSTPSSRIISRSSTDQSTVDTDIPYRLAGLVFALIQLICVVILMSLVAWQVIPLFLFVLGLSFWYQGYYIVTARELARMVANQKSPVIHHFQESITGAATIRCFNQEDRFLRKIMNVIDDFSGVAFCNYATMEWLSLRINFFFNLAFFAVLIVLVSLPSSAIDPSLAGLAASYGLKLSVLQGWVIWNLCNVEDKMISVKRILQFTRIKSEASHVIEGCRPKPEWPTEGLIEVQNLQIQYRPSLPMVLKGITCTFPGKKKIGVVGRTGSGKSTLIQALFRVVEPSRGQILIDGLDITRIGLQDLRSRLAIIPQDPTLFHGTMRTNLDPLQQHSDLEIWEVLNKRRLGDIVRQDQRLLDAPVAEDGENWSIGQRQLVCLARVLLKKRRILVLDEATASIDTATEMLIQETIREETSACTIITVAHRIPTVIDNDLVLVLDQGKIVEFDSPARLLRDSSSAFSKLVAEFLRRSSRSRRNC